MADNSASDGNQGLVNEVRVKSKTKTERKLYVRPELYEVDRPDMTWLVRIAIVLTMAAMVFALRRALLSAFSS